MDDSGPEYLTLNMLITWHKCLEVMVTKFRDVYGRAGLAW